MKQPVSRRRFLHQSGAAGLGLWMAPGLDLPPKEKVNVACIGVGGSRGYGDLKGVATENIVALCDVDDRQAEKAYKEFPDAKKYRDFRVMLEKQKDIEAVVIATPDHLHAVAAKMALDLDKHVYCEKPLTHSIYEARVLTEAAAKKPRLKTQMGNQGHSLDNRRLFVEIMRSGMLGGIREVHCFTNRPLWPQGMDRPQGTPPPPAELDWDLWLGPAPERPFHPAYLPFKWRGWWDFGTGALGDMACHIMDAAYWGLDLGYPVSVEAEGEPRHPESAPKWMTVRLEFPARGEKPPVRLTWYDGEKPGLGPNRPPAELVPGQEIPQNGVIAVGEKGTLFITHEQGMTYKLLPEERFVGVAMPEQTLPRVPGSMDGHHQEWIAAIKGGAPNLSSFAYAGPFTETVLIGIAAFRAGERLEWDGPNMKATNTAKAGPFLRREYRKGWSL